MVEAIQQILLTVILFYILIIFPVQITRLIKKKTKSKYIAFVIPGIFQILIIIMHMFPIKFLVLDNQENMQVLGPFALFGFLMDLGFIVLKAMLLFYLYIEFIITLIAMLVPIKYNDIEVLEHEKIEQKDDTKNIQNTSSTTEEKNTKSAEKLPQKICPECHFKNGFLTSKCVNCGREFKKK